MPIRELRSTDISLSDLPLDLLCLPLMLILLSWMSVSEVITIVSLFVCVLFSWYTFRGKLRKVAFSLLIYFLQIAAFYSLEWLSSIFLPQVQSLCLWREMLFMLSFLGVQFLLYALLRHNKFPHYPQAKCSCERRRNEALRAEYIRFDRFLIRFCLFGIVLCLLCSLLMNKGWVVEIVLSHSLSVLAAAILLFELLHLAWLRKRLLAEQWIPIFDEANKPVARVPRSEADTILQGTLPCVRLLAISQGMLYLEQKIQDGGQSVYDTPFEDWLSEGECPEEVAQRMIDARFCGIRRAIPRRLLPYRISVGGQSRLVYLMVVEIEDPGLLYIDCRPVEGKWWSLQELEGLMNYSACSPYLSSEWQTLEQTLFLAKRLRSQ